MGWDAPEDWLPADVVDKMVRPPHQPASIAPGMITYVEVPRMDFLYRGVLVNSALYLLTVWATGLLWSRPWAVYATIAALGFTYLNYLALAVQQEGSKSVLGSVLNAAAIVLGVAAGLLLLGGR